MLQNRNLATLLIAILGALKIILQAFGVDIITSQQVDAIANGIAALVTVVGVIMTHLKHAPDNKQGTSGPPSISSHPKLNADQTNPDPRQEPAKEG